MKELAVTPVVLSGGIGARLWPVSRESFPKPFMPMADGESLLQKTYRRAAAIAGHGQVLTVTHRDYYFMSQDEWERASLSPSIKARYLLEPISRNTSAAVALAALQVMAEAGPEALVMVLAADHLIQDQEGFERSVQSAARLAAGGHLVTFGIPPTAPETGYGYIQVGEPLAGGHEVLRFVEKPSQDTAEDYLRSGDFLWNAGMFCFRAESLLQALQRYAPDVHGPVLACWDAAARDMDRHPTSFLTFPTGDFSAIPDRSIDYAVMEHSDNVAVIRADFDWSDVGSWSAVGALLPADESHNRSDGAALFVDTRNTFVKTDGRLVAALGLDDLLIIDTPDALLVAHTDRAQDVKTVVSRLKAQNHPSCCVRRTGIRPWGTYTILEEQSGYKIKRIEVWPGRTLSLQMHHHRSEHWVVVSGMARVLNGESEIFVRPNESTYIPAGCVHRLSNPGRINLVLIEVQSGQYLEEEDIVRLDDEYGRSG
jgi:mannose-1-phosphate guanylyltransferase / mannose-6-phosphate isomerase